MALHLDRGSVDLVAVDMDIREVLEKVFLQMDAYFDLPPEVQGTVSVSIHNATFEQALELILGERFTYTIGPHDVIYIHRAGTTWRPGSEHIP